MNLEFKRPPTIKYTAEDHTKGIISFILLVLFFLVFVLIIFPAIKLGELWDKILSIKRRYY